MALLSYFKTIKKCKWPITLHVLKFMSWMKSATSLKLSIFSTTYESENARYSFNIYCTSQK